MKDVEINQEELNRLDAAYIEQLKERNERLGRPITLEDLYCLNEIMDTLLALRADLTTLQLKLVEPFPQTIGAKASKECADDIHKILDEINYTRGQIDVWESEFETLSSKILFEIMPEE
jgi:hypothetical protein